MNVQTLNGPLEVGLRQLTLLNSAFPKALDIATLALMDHSVLHSADLGGPSSLHPGVPNYRAEQAIKRELIEHGLQVMIRAGLINLHINAEGILYAASERARPFLKLLDASYMRDLEERADWVVRRFTDDQAESQERDATQNSVGSKDVEDLTP